MEQARGQGAGDGGGEDGRQPDAGVLHDVAHLEHGGAQPLAHQAAPAVLPEGEDGEAHHVGAAPRHRRAAGQTREAEGRADGRRGDGQGQGHADDHADHDAHEEGLELGGPHDDVAHRRGGGADGRGPPSGQTYPRQNGHQGGHQDVNLGLLAHRLAQLGGDDGDEQHRQGAAGPGLVRDEAGGAQGVGGIAHRGQGEEHQGGRLEGAADGHGHSRAAHGGGVIAHVHQEGEPRLLSQGLDDGADEQGAEQALGHGAQRVDAVAPGGEHDVLALEERVDSFHFFEPLVFFSYVS